MPPVLSLQSRLYVLALRSPEVTLIAGTHHVIMGDCELKVLFTDLFKRSSSNHLQYTLKFVLLLFLAFPCKNSFILDCGCNFVAFCFYKAFHRIHLLQA